MADFEIPWSVAKKSELEVWSASLKDTLENALAGSAKVRRSAGTSDDDSFEQSIIVTIEGGGELEVTLEWDKDDPKLQIDVAAPSKIKGPLAYLPMVLALGFGFFADKSPELLPVFRGVRVMIGLVVGLVVGFLLTGVLGGVLGAKAPSFDPALEEKVRERIRAAVESARFAA